MSSTIQHRYNLRSIAKQAMNQPVKIIKEEPPIIKISIFVYLLRLMSYLFEICTPDVYKNMLKRQSEQDANNMQKDREEQGKEEEAKEERKKEEREEEGEEEREEEGEEETEEEKEEEEEEKEEEEEEREEESIEQLESLSHTNIYGLISLIKTYINRIDHPETRYLKQRRYNSK